VPRVPAPGPRISGRNDHSAQARVSGYPLASPTKLLAAPPHLIGAHSRRITLCDLGNYSQRHDTTQDHVRSYIQGKRSSLPLMSGPDTRMLTFGTFIPSSDIVCRLPSAQLFYFVFKIINCVRSALVSSCSWLECLHVGTYVRTSTLPVVEAPLAIPPKCQAWSVSYPRILPQSSHLTGFRFASIPYAASLIFHKVTQKGKKERNKKERKNEGVRWEG